MCALVFGSDLWRWWMVCGNGVGDVGLVSVVFYFIFSNRLYCCHFRQDLFAVYSNYTIVFNITAIFCNGKVYSMINCKGFSRDCIITLFPFHYNHPEKCSFASNVT